MTTGGIQTHDFMTRLQKVEDSFPPFLLELARVMERMIQELDRPELEDILRLHQDLRQIIGEAEELRRVCGTEGKLCSQCPFGAYLPSGFAYASEKQALCLPWIVVVHPEPVSPPTR